MLKYLKYVLCNCVSGEYLYSITITNTFNVIVLCLYTTRTYMYTTHTLALS